MAWLCRLMDFFDSKLPHALWQLTANKTVSKVDRNISGMACRSI
jgi:hypothetical protein